MRTNATAVDNSTDRRIESDRLTKTLSEDFEVAANADDALQYEVTHSGATYRNIDVETGVCECKDYEHRGEQFLCKHVLRASIAHAYRTVANTELVARVLGHVAEAGCVHDVAGCDGPTRLGERGIPCEGCIAATPGHWTMWSRLVALDDTSNPGGELAIVEASVATDQGSATKAMTDGGHTPDTRCGTCGTDWNEAEEGYACPSCGSTTDRHVIRSERADFGGGEGGIDAL